MAGLTIMGGGVFGLALAFVASARGVRVRVIEKRRIGAGASGGVVGALAPHVPENWNPKKAFQLEALLEAAAFWAGVARVSGRDPGYARTGRIQPLADSAVDLAQARARGAAALWQGQAVWQVRPAADFAGLVPLTPGGLVIHDTLSARLHPRMALAALAAGVAAQGGTLTEGATTTPPAGPDQVVWCTGYEGLGDLSAALGRVVGTGVKGQALTLAHDVRAAPQIFADGVHIVPHADGTVAIGSTSERDYATPDQTDAQCDALLARARALCPALTHAPVIERWAGVRPRARSRAPMLGAWPGRPGHFVFNGGFKIGFALAPALARVMADLVLDGVDRIPHGFGVQASL